MKTLANRYLIDSASWLLTPALPARHLHQPPCPRKCNPRSPLPWPVRIPPFHYGSVVPLDFFIDRELELDGATDLITTRQSFLIVGRRRAGKTSFGQKLIKTVKTRSATAKTRILGSYLDLQQYSALDVDRFLAHTLLNLIGEVARESSPADI